jgi:protein-S-isoprenylcysteine O-methyltransferase Ste14
MLFQRFLPSLISILAINALLLLVFSIFFPQLVTWERLVFVSIGVLIGFLLWPWRAKPETRYDD